jgi:NAD(P)-dependent dehydrogenase (short-subunit alcohol dehydrogenase family)
MNFPELQGKVAVITGAGAGIGKATAVAFAREGVNVAVVDWSVKNGRSTVEEIGRLATENITPGRAVFIQADVSKNDHAEHIAEETLTAFGRIDILHNNAGIQTYGTVVSTDEETWDKTLNVNLKSIYLVSKYIIPHLIKGGGGSIINTSSIQAQACLANSAAYVASKGAVLALTREMALDFAPHNIRVNAILPGSINTPMLQFAASQEEEPNKNKVIEDWGKIYPLGRVGLPEEVAGLVVFLTTNAAAFITGAPLAIDGGLIAKLF